MSSARTGSASSSSGARGGHGAWTLPDHVLLSGPPGLGKTTLAMIIAHEMGAPLRVTSGPAIQHAGDLAAILSGLTEGDVLFLDEIHRMAGPPRRCSTWRWRTSGSTWSSARARARPRSRWRSPRSRSSARPPGPGLLPGPLRDRFGFTAQLEFYEPAELELIVNRSAGLLEVEIRPPGAAEIASRSRGTPRIANRLLRRVRDYAQVRADGVVDRLVARAALELYEVDELRTRPAGPGCARRVVPPFRRGTGRPLDPGGRRR